MLSSTN